jgi:cell division protein FtsB
MNWVSYLGISFSVLTAIGNVIILLAVKFNDLKHVQISLEEIKIKIDANDKRLDSLSERVATIEGRLKRKR